MKEISENISSLVENAKKKKKELGVTISVSLYHLFTLTCFYRESKKKMS